MRSATQPATRIDGQRLFHEVTSIHALALGWERVAANRGAAGGDGVGIERFAVNAAERLAILSTGLRDGSYVPGPLRQVDIPKKTGGLRRLKIPCVVDRVAQSAVAQHLGPLLDSEFETSSYGYRQGRGVADAVRRVETLRQQGYIWTIDADIDDFFDNIPIDPLLVRLGRSMSESPLTDLIARWLEFGATMGRGVAQGSPLSPLLANLYLDDMDEALNTRGVRIVRYADDFVILTRDRPSAEAAWASLETLLKGYGLQLDREKTKLRSYDDTVRFLGHLFVRGWAMPAPNGEGPPDSIETLMAQIAREDARRVGEDRSAEAVAEKERSAGLDRGLRLLHVGEPGRRLGLRNLSFAVFEASDKIVAGTDGELLALHPGCVDRIETGPSVETDAATLKLAIAHNIPVAFVDGHGQTMGHAAPVLAPRAGRHLAQARHVLDPSLRLDLARRIVAGRIANQRSLLRRINHRRGVAGIDIAATRLRRMPDEAAAATSIEQALGFEGEAAAVYWRAWGSLLLHGFSFKTRERRANRDSVNIALDVLCGQLERDVGAVLLGCGLHPGFGVLHGTSDRHDACIYDMMEEFRAGLVESVVLTLVNTQSLRRDMFSKTDDGGVRLMREGMRALIRGYEDRAEKAVTSPRSGKRVSWRRLMREQAEEYAAHVEGRRVYAPYVLDN